jgi:DNA repair protein RadA/Sms
LKKPTTRFICQTCGSEFKRWAGKCESCNTWNSIIEETNTEKFQEKKSFHLNYKKPIPLDSKTIKEYERIKTGFSELDLVFGGGIVPGSLGIIGGEPGIGKSTLILMISKMLSPNNKILYISGEESSSQILSRAKRLNIQENNILISSETTAETIEQMIRGEKPNLVFIDSIQTISREKYSNQAGTVTQLRECTQLFLEVSKSTNIPILLIGHITKEGSIAGPRVLEHLVDIVLYFESDKLNTYRLVRAIKNRFGSVGDIAIFEMNFDGLKEIKNKHDLYLSDNEEMRTGTVLSTIMEGSRSTTVEIQALVSKSGYSQPRRMSEGLDNRRLIMLAAVMEKFLKIPFSEFDIFSNLAGGITNDEPALDLAICISILSSYMDFSVPKSTAVLGEIGLSGEIRPIHSLPPRLKELFGLGIQRIFIPERNLRELEKPTDKIIGLKNLSEYEKIFQFGNESITNQKIIF